MTPIDHLLFGNGHGLGSPKADVVYYWLSGRFYQRFGWHGSQLVSYEWRRPKPGTVRRILGREFRVFHAKRRLVRWRISWTMPLTGDMEADNALIRELDADLRRIGH